MALLVLCPVFGLQSATNLHMLCFNDDILHRICLLKRTRIEAVYRVLHGNDDYGVKHNNHDDIQPSAPKRAGH